MKLLIPVCGLMLALVARAQERVTTATTANSTNATELNGLPASSYALRSQIVGNVTSNNGAYTLPPGFDLISTNSFVVTNIASGGKLSLEPSGIKAGFLPYEDLTDTNVVFLWCITPAIMNEVNLTNRLYAFDGTNCWFRDGTSSSFIITNDNGCFKIIGAGNLKATNSSLYGVYSSAFGIYYSNLCVSPVPRVWWAHRYFNQAGHGYTLPSWTTNSIGAGNVVCYASNGVFWTVGVQADGVTLNVTHVP